MPLAPGEFQTPREGGQAEQAPPPVGLEQFASLARWLRWREELRKNKDGTLKKTKVPHHATLPRAGKSNDPDTWATRAEAERALSQLTVEPGFIKGVGIVLGDLGDGRFIWGVDLDHCRNPSDGSFTPWADRIIRRTDSLTEVSPSGTGVKIYGTADIELLSLFKTWPHEVKQPHPEGGKDQAIESYGTGRFFAVTNEILEGFRTVRHVDRETLAAVVAEMHAFAPKKAKHQAEGKARRERNRLRGPHPDFDPLRWRAEDVARNVDPENAGNWHGKELKIRCPCHDDDDPSLDLSNEADGELNANCRAGCLPADVYAELRKILGERPSGERRQSNGHAEEPPPPRSEDVYGKTSTSSSSGGRGQAGDIDETAARLRKNLDRKVGETTEYVGAEVKSDTKLQRLALAVFNLRFALFKPGASDVVIDKSKPGLDLIKIPDFLRRYSRITAKHKEGRVSLAKLWLALPGAQRVERVVLRPNKGVLDDPRLWNMAGHFITPKKGDEPPFFFQLVRSAFRQADGEWLLDWVADIVQNPQTKPDTVPAINGKAGCGKTRFWRYIGKTLGDALYYEMSGLAGIGNKFNADTEAALLIFVDEAEAKDLRSSLPLFKTLATGSTRRIERKGIDPFAIPNITRLALAGEHKPVLLSDGGMRRRVPLFEMLPTFKGNLQFWNGYDVEMKSDGPARLLAFLLDRKITHRLHEAPITEIARWTAREHLEPLYLWLVGLIESFSRWHDGVPRHVVVAELMLDLREWWKANQQRGAEVPNAARIAAALKLAGATYSSKQVRATVDGKRVRSGLWFLPKAADMAAILSVELGIDIDPDDAW